MKTQGDSLLVEYPLEGVGTTAEKNFGAEQRPKGSTLSTYK